MEESRLLHFDFFFFFVNAGPHGAGNLKTLLLLHISSDVNKLHENIDYHGGVQAIIFLGNQPSFENFLTLGNFNVGVNGKIIMCAISRKRQTLERLTVIRTP